MLRFQAVPSLPLAFSSALPGSALGAVAAAVASTTPQRLRDINALATSPRGPAIVGRSGVLGAQIGLRAAWQLWIWFAANASGAILGVGGSAAMMIAPLVSLSVLAAMVVPAFWALLCFGGAGFLSGILGGTVLASGVSPAYLALSLAQARLRAAVVIGAMTSPGIVAVAVSYGLAPSVMDFFPEDLGRSGEHIDWKTKRSRFREV